jgi:hypothetical protein
MKKKRKQRQQQRRTNGSDYLKLGVGLVVLGAGLKALKT